MGAGLIVDFIPDILSVPFCPYHFVYTILSNTILSVYHLSVPFCPLPFCPRTLLELNNYYILVSINAAVKLQILLRKVAICAIEKPLFMFLFIRCCWKSCYSNWPIVFLLFSIVTWFVYYFCYHLRYSVWPMLLPSLYYPHWLAITAYS